MVVTLFLLCLLPCAFSQKAVQTCKDVNSKALCDYWKGLKYCSSDSEFYPYMKKECSKSCGFCQVPGQHCKDIKSTRDCTYWKGLQHCKSTNQYYPFMKKNCIKTCGFCKSPATTPHPVPTPQPRTVRPTSAQGCKDTKSTRDCTYWKGLEHCKSTNQYYPFMKKNCPKTCGFCKAPPVPRCKDTKSTTDCTYWKGLEHCKSTNLYYPFMKKNCPKTCGFCRSSAIPKLDDDVDWTSNDPSSVAGGSSSFSCAGKPGKKSDGTTIKYTDPADCHYWYECLGGKASRYMCFMAGHRFYVNLQFCKTGNCNVKGGFCSGNPGTKSDGTTIKYADPDATKCSTWIECRNGVYKEYKCFQSGYIFNSSKQFCVKGKCSSSYAAPAAQTCKDVSGKGLCDYWKGLSYCSSNSVYNHFMKKQCSKTCGFCQTPGTTKAPVTVRPTSAGCKDIRSAGDCSYWKGLQYCKSSNKFYQFMQKQCPKTCGFCGKPATTAFPVPTARPTRPPVTTARPTSGQNCKDIRSKDDCAYWKGLQYCKSTNQYYQFMKKQCPKTCGFCQKPATTLHPVPPTRPPTPGNPELDCTFEKDLCRWKNVNSKDDYDWSVGIATNGPRSGAGGSSKYAYVDTLFSNSKARLVLPLNQIGVANKGTMCLRFNFITGKGSLKVIEEMNGSERTLFTLQGSGGWSLGWVQVTVDNKRQIVIEGKTGFYDRVSLDNIVFASGRC